MDILEKNIIKAIYFSSVYSVKEIENVYSRTKSFDKTIIVLKHAVSHAISIDDALIQLNFGTSKPIHCKNHKERTEGCPDCELLRQKCVE